MTRPPTPRTLETALYALDIATCATFWSEVIGLEEISRTKDRHVFFRTANGVLLIFNPDVTEKPPAPDARLPVPPHGTRGPGHFCMAATADEIEVWKAYLERAGVEIEADFEWPQGGRSIYFRDPAGNSIEIADPKIWD